MPGAVIAAAPTTVMPLVLCAQFRQSRVNSTDINRYVDGTQQSSNFNVTSRKSWALVTPLTASALTALRTFYSARTGPGVEFYFYDLFEATPMADVSLYDPTGVSINGRMTVRFGTNSASGGGKFTQALGLGRNQAQIALIEVG